MGKKIQFLDYQKLNKNYKKNFLSSLSNFIDKGWFILGEEVEKFEKEYSNFSKVKYCIGVANGLDALVLSLKSLDIGPKDEVIVPANTYIASWLAVDIIGARPIPVEPRIDTYNINPSLIEEKISPQTKAVMAVNLYGQSAELSSIKKICDKNNIHLIEDNAQSQGATCNNKPTGSYGIINATSFYPGKNLGSLGDAGAVTTDKLSLAKNIKILRNYGSNKKYYNLIKGYNSRLDELQASFLRIKLKKLNNDNKKRIKIAEIYNSLLKSVGDIILPKIHYSCTSVYHLYIIRTQNREKLINYLNQKGIGTMIHYPIPPHLQKAYENFNFKKGSFPITEKIADTCLSLPIGPYFTNNEIEYVADSIKKFYISN
mgnify:CR=1 FL=1